MKKLTTILLTIMMMFTLIGTIPGIAAGGDPVFVTINNADYTRTEVTSKSYDVMQDGTRNWNTHRYAYTDVNANTVANASYIAIRFNSGNSGGGGMTVIAKDSQGNELIPAAGTEIVTIPLVGDMATKQLVNYNGVNGMSWSFPMFWSGGFNGWLLFPVSAFGMTAGKVDISQISLGYASPTGATVFTMSDISAVTLMQQEEIYVMSDPNYTPVVRFLAVTDLHFGTQSPGAFENAMAQFYKMAAKHPSYTGVDAVISAGDNVQVAQEADYQKLEAALASALKPETQFISCYGNHEYLDSGMNLMPQADADALWNQYVDLKMDDVYDLNGFKVITNSPRNMSDFSTNLDWLKKSLGDAVTADPDKPIFVFQHFQAPDGGLGSDETIASMAHPYEIMKDYSQIINFSGHTHQPLTNPASVRQQYYTSVVGGYWFYNNPKVTPSNEPIGYQAMIVEVDANNEVRMYPYSFRYNEYLTDAPYVVNAKEGRTDSFAIEDFEYTDARKDASQSPVFPGGSNLDVSDITATSFKMTFGAAQDDEMVVRYRAILTRKDTGAKLREETITSGYAMHQIPTSYTHTITGAFAGVSAVLSIYAEDPYGNLSEPLVKDIDFPGTLLDKIDFENITQSDIADYVVMGGKTAGYATGALSLADDPRGAGNALKLTNIPAENSNFIYQMKSVPFAGIITYGESANKFYSFYIKNDLGCDAFLSAKLYNQQRLATLETNDAVYLENMSGGIAKASTDIGSTYNWLSFMDTRYAIIPKNFEGYVHISLNPDDLQQGMWNGVNVLTISDATEVSFDIRGFLPTAESETSMYLDDFTLTAELELNTEVTVTTTAGVGGSITPETQDIAIGSNVTFTITPDEGYVIDDVKVNGISIGKVSTHTINGISQDTTIEATFTEDTEGPSKTGDSWSLPMLLLCIGSMVLLGSALYIKQRFSKTIL